MTTSAARGLLLACALAACEHRAPAVSSPSPPSPRSLPPFGARFGEPAAQVRGALRGWTFLRRTRQLDGAWSVDEYQGSFDGGPAELSAFYRADRDALFMLELRRGPSTASPSASWQAWVQLASHALGAPARVDVPMAVARATPDFDAAAWLASVPRDAARLDAAIRRRDWVPNARWSRPDVEVSIFVEGAVVPGRPMSPTWSVSGR